MLFNNLLKLTKKEDGSRPLEDFTTEIFSGILNIYEDLKYSFIVDFLKLPKDEKYFIRTQVKYTLPEYPEYSDPIVDMVIESDRTICFIENKVGSQEGYKQLEKYSLVLDRFQQENKRTKLVYCTKNYDPKNIKNHDFKYTRWYKIAEFLKKRKKEDKLITEFLNFLNKHDMSQELTFTPSDYITANNLQSTISKFKEYLIRAKPSFEDTFKSNLSLSDGCNIKQILVHNRLIFYYKDIVSHPGYSEIKYGFLLDKPQAYAGIWIDQKNPEYTKYLEIIKTYESNKLYSVGILDGGAFFEIKKDISVFLNDEKAESEIVAWFNDAFRQLAEFIRSTPEISWQIKIK